MRGKKTILNGIELARLEILRLERERLDLEKLKEELPEDTYSREMESILLAIRAHTAERSRLISIIDSIPDDVQRELMRFRYVSRFSWEEIAEIMDYSETRIFQFRAMAVNWINERYPS